MITYTNLWIRVRNYHDHNDYEDRKGKTFKVGDLEIEDEAV